MYILIFFQLYILTCHPYRLYITKLISGLWLSTVICSSPVISRVSCRSLLRTRFRFLLLSHRPASRRSTAPLFALLPYAAFVTLYSSALILVLVKFVRMLMRIFLVRSCEYVGESCVLYILKKQKKTTTKTKQKTKQK